MSASAIRLTRRAFVAFSLGAVSALLSGCAAGLSEDDRARVEEDQRPSEASSSSPAPSSDARGLSAEDQEAVDALVGAQAALQVVDPSDIPERLAAAQEANPDVCAWLYVPGTNVSLAVARHLEDDLYYMEHAADGSQSPIGSAFLEGANSPGFDDPVTVLYGHSFSDAEIMFTQLHCFESIEFFGKAESFYVYLPDRVLAYRVVGACLYSNERIVAGLDFSDQGSLQSYFDFVADGDDEAFIGLKRRTGSLDAASDRLVQLSTCTLPRTDGSRYVVTGVLVGEGAA